MLSACLGAGDKVECALLRKGHIRIWGNDIDLVDFDCHVLACLMDLYASESGQQVRQQAFMPRVQMLHHDVGHPCIVWKRMQKLLERHQTTSRGSNSYNRK